MMIHDSTDFLLEVGVALRDFQLIKFYYTIITFQLTADLDYDSLGM